MMPVATSAVLEAPIDKVWDIISDFCNLRRWHPLVVSCEGNGREEGATRKVRFEDWWAEEKLTRLDNAGRSLDYQVTDSSRPPVIGVKGTMALTDLGDGTTRIDWRSGHEDSHPSAGPVNEGLAAYYPARIGHLRAALGLASAAA